MSEEPDGGETVTDPTLVKLTGSQTTDVTPLTGSDCRPAIAAFGGPFLALPWQGFDEGHGKSAP